MTGTKRHTKILIVDDDPSVLFLANRFLEANYDTYQATTLEKAKEITLKILPQVVILDIHLREENGLKFIKWKNSHLVLKSVKVISMSSDSLGPTVKKAIAYGADDFITKPLVNHILIKKIKKVLLNSELHEFQISPKISSSKIKVQCQKIGEDEDSIVLAGTLRPDPDDHIIVESHPNDIFKATDKSQIFQGITEKIILKKVGQNIDDSRLKQSKDFDIEDFMLKTPLEIFILDDDINMSNLISFFLKKFPISVSSATSIPDFLELFKTKTPDLCIIDLTIKEENDTFGLIEILHKKRPGMPLIVATSNTDGIASAHSIEIGASDFIYKPIDRNLLIAKIAFQVKSDLVESPKILESSRQKTQASLTTKEHENLFLEVTLKSIDELGMHFISQSFIKKGTQVLLTDFLPEHFPSGIGLVITKVSHSASNNNYENYAEFSEDNANSILLKVEEHCQ